MDKHTLEVMLKFSLDPAAQERIRNGTSNIKDELKKVQDSANATRESMEKISSVSLGLAAGGTAILAPALLAAQKYVSYMGQADETSRRWIAANQQIDQATMRIGETVARVVLPYLEQAANMAERFAGFVSENPEVTRVILSVAGVLAGGGAVLATAANIAKQVATVQLLASKYMQEAADKQLAASEGMAVGGSSGMGQAGATLGKVALAAGAVYIGGEAGLAIGNWLNKITNNDARDQKWGNILATVERLAAITAYGYAQIAKFFGLDDVSKSILGVVKTLGDMSYEADKAAESVDNLVPEIKKVGLVNDQRLQGFIEMQKQINRAQEQYEKERTRIIAEAEKNRAEISQRIADEIEKYNKAEIKEREKLNASISKVQERLEADEAKAKEAHLDRLKTLEESHDAKILDLRIRRDAEGIKQEKKDYDKSVKTENKSYDQETREKREAARQQIADLRASAREQRQERKEAYDALMADLKKERDLVKNNRDDELRKLTESYTAQVNMIQTNFVDRLNAMSQSIMGNTAAFQRLMKEKAIEFQNWIDDFKKKNKTGTTSGREYALGGYSYTDGPAYLHANEFVLNSTTTRALEAKNGSSLTQNAIIAGFGNHGSGGGNTYNVSVGGTFNGVSTQTQMEVVALIREEIDAAFVEIFEEK